MKDYIDNGNHSAVCCVMGSYLRTVLSYYPSSIANVSHLHVCALRFTSPGCGVIRSSLLKFASVALEAIDLAVLDACMMLSSGHLALLAVAPAPGFSP